jgi:hypothetical protein
LLSDASPQVVQVAIESVNLFLVVDSLQRGSGDGAEKSAGAVENVGNVAAQTLASVNRPDQRTHTEGDNCSQQRIKHAKPRHVPGLSLPAEDQNQGGREPCRREAGV